MRSLDGLLEFVAVAETGGFARAAARLKVSTAHISRQVAALEARLGARLFVRTTRSVRPTEAGALLQSRAGALLAGLDDVFDEIGDAEATPRGLVRVAAGGAYGERIVAPALVRFLAANPSIQVHLDISDRRVDLAREGFDLAVRLGALEESSLVARKVSARRMVLCASPAYLEAAPRLRSVDDLRAHVRLGSPDIEWRLKSGAGLFRIKPDGPLSSNNIPALVEAAIAGLGLAWLAETHVRAALEDGRLVRVLAASETEGDAVWLVHPSRAYVPRRTRAVMDWLAAELS